MYFSPQFLFTKYFSHSHCSFVTSNSNNTFIYVILLVFERQWDFSEGKSTIVLAKKNFLQIILAVTFFIDLSFLFSFLDLRILFETFQVLGVFLILYFFLCILKKQFSSTLNYLRQRLFTLLKLMMRPLINSWYSLSSYRRISSHLVIDETSFTVRYM